MRCSTKTNDLFVAGVDVPAKKPGGLLKGLLNRNASTMRGGSKTDTLCK